MIIGINAAAAVKKQRTGVEEYAYQLIKHLTMLPEAAEHRFFLYVPGNIVRGDFFDFPLPDNFEIKILRWPLPVFWAQIRLAWEIAFNAPDVLFIPAHILPFGAPKNSVVAIHGLEYEYWPQYYPPIFRRYLRWSTRRAAARARRIIAVSENTKKDLMKLYGYCENKIVVVYHGVHPRLISPSLKEGERGARSAPEGVDAVKPYILYLGRLETKKNVQGILSAYKILKEKYGAPHSLILAGSPGYGYKNLKFKIENLLEIVPLRGIAHSAKNWKLEIIETGYVDEEEKRQLLANADLFLFPSFYEGFGLPVLEAQAMGAPVVVSDNSSLPEVAGEGAVLINPQNPAQIAEAAAKIFEDKEFRDKIVAAGYENARRFDWNKCARKTLSILIN